MPEIIRSCRFKTHAHRYSLKLWLTGCRDSRGQEYLGYALQQDGRELFAGADFSPSPLHALDSDEAVASLMSFLTLRRGDTNADYFASYTPAQIAFTEDDAEELSLAVEYRFRALFDSGAV